MLRQVYKDDVIPVTSFFSLALLIRKEKYPQIHDIGPRGNRKGRLARGREEHAQAAPSPHHPLIGILFGGAGCNRIFASIIPPPNHRKEE